MADWVFIVGMVILALSIAGAALIVASAITAVSKAGTGASSLAQPPLRFFTEYDAADYLGVSLKELDFMRENGMLSGSYFAVTSLEQTGEEEYYEVVDGVEVVKLRPVMSNVTRYLFDRELLDERIGVIIREGAEIDTGEKRRRKEGYKSGRTERPAGQNASEKPAEKPAEKTEKPAEKLFRDNNRDSRPKNGGQQQSRRPDKKNEQNDRRGEARTEKPKKEPRQGKPVITFDPVTDTQDEE